MRCVAWCSFFLSAAACALSITANHWAFVLASFVCLGISLDAVFGIRKL
jgi:hypothetical protein